MTLSNLLKSIPSGFFLFLYNLLVILFTPLLLVRLLKKSLKQKAYRQNLSERLGLIKTGKVDLWVHAVSLGEARVAVLMLNTLCLSLEGQKRLKVMLSCITPTGREVLNNWRKEQQVCEANLCYLPFDSSIFVRSVLAKASPKVVVCIETELWPVFLNTASRPGAKLILANARLSKKSARKIRVFHPFFASILQSFLVLAQDAHTAGRYSALGCKEVEICGSSKFDQVPEVDKEWVFRLKKFLHPKKKTIVFGSTRKDEIEVYIEVCSALHNHNDLYIIWVPRHPHYVPKIADRLKADSIDHLVIADINKLPQILKSNLLIIQGFGALHNCYNLADLVVMGGTFGTTGSQNVIEVAQQGKCIISGPSQYNFAEAHAMLKKYKGAYYVNSTDELIGKIMLLAEDQQARQKTGAKAKVLVKKKKGSINRQLEFIKKEILKSS